MRKLNRQDFKFMYKTQLIKRIVVAIAISLAGSATMFAQDVITLKNGDDIQAVVQEVGTDEVKYKKFDNKNGPTYSIKKSEIFTIRYENGSKDVFTIGNRTSQPIQNQSQRTPSDICIEDPILDNIQWFGNRMMISNVSASNKQILKVMQKTSSESYNLYKSGKRLRQAGRVFNLVGVGGTVAGVGMIVLGNNEDSRNKDNRIKEGTTYITVGAVSFFCVGLPLSISGGIVKRAGLKKFKTSCFSGDLVEIDNDIQLNLQVNQNGLGLALVF